MSNLEQAILEWRQQMLAAGIKTPVPLEELEIHLREEIERQIQSGQNEQQVFEVAIRQIGKANMLKHEFSKVEETIEARQFKKSQFALIFSLSIFLLIFTTFFIFSSQLTAGERIFGLAAVATTILAFCIGQLSRRFIPVILNQRVRIITGLSGYVLYVLWMVGFAYLVLPRFDFTVSQLFMAIYWSWIVPFGFLNGLILGIEKVAMKKATTDLLAD